MRTFRALSLLLALSACSQDDGPRGIDAGPSERPDDEPGPDDPSEVMTHTECLLADEQLDLAALMKIPPASGDGTSEVAVSADGCVRLVRTVSGGQLSALSLRRWTGVLSFDAGVPPDYSNLDFFEAEAVFMELKTSPDGSRELSFDPDGDGKLDGRLSESYSGERVARRELTRFNPASGQVVQRRTLTMVDADTIHWKHEKLRDNVLTTVQDFDAPALQNQATGCYTPTPMGQTNDTVPCGDDFKEMVRESMRTAIERAVSCFDRFEDGASLEQLQLWLFYQMHGDSIEIECFQSDEYVGQMDTGSKGPKMRVNIDLFRCATVDYRESTLFHEVLHEIRGPHDEYDNDLGGDGFGERAHTYTDSIRGCEQICFNGNVQTRCACASCFESDTCDERCTGMDGCVVRNDMGMYTMSEAVGALCRDPAHAMSKWFPTMMACQSGCAFGATQCKSYSLSCDDSCQ